MHRPDRSCFGRHAHSDAERRLLFFGGFESGFGRSSGGGQEAARERLFREYEAGIRAKAEMEKRGLSRSYQNFVDKETEKEIREARDRFNRGETFYKIRNVQDAHYVAAQLTHRINGDVQDPHMDNAWDTTPQGKKAERDRRTKELHAVADARTDAMLAEYDQSVATGVPPRWQTLYFREENIVGRQGLLKIWVEGGLNVPSQVLAQHGLVLNNGLVERLDGMPIQGAFVRRSPNNPNAQPGSPVARQALAFPDVAAGLPQKVSERDAKQPGFPMQFYERDPYGGFKLSKDKILRANTEQELIIRRQQFEQQLAAARQHMQQAFAALQARVDYAMGPEKADLLKLQSDMRELVTAAENNTPAIAENLAQAARDGALKPGDASVLSRYPADMKPDMARQLYLSQKLPTSLESIAVRCEAELKKREMLAFNNGQDLHVDFLVKYFVAKTALENARATQAEREPAVMQALNALNAYGSHIFRNYRGTIVDDKTRQAFVDAAIANAKERGLAKSDGDIKKALITQDDEGIPKLLKMRSDLMHALQFPEGDTLESSPVSIPAMEWHLHATRMERAYIQAHSHEPQAKIDPNRAPELEMREARSLGALQGTLAKETNDLLESGADAATVIAAANKELAFLEANDIDTERVPELSARERDDELGIIPSQYELLHEPLRDATNAIAEPGTPVEFRQRLQAIKAEGRFLHKYVSQMARSVEARLPELLAMQEEDTLGLIDATFASIDKNDPVAVGNAVADIATTYVRPLESNAQSKNTAAAARAKLEPKALELRVLVNPLVANTRKSAEADAAASIDGIDVALAAINAEARALDVLKLDPARVLALREDMKLLDARVAVRQAEEKKLEVKKDSAPTVDDFRKVYGLLRGEEKAMRMVYANNPDALKARVSAIDQRRRDYGAMVHSAAAAAINRLNDKSEMKDASDAEELLRLSLRLRLGEMNESVPVMDLAKRLPTSVEYQDAEQAKSRIDRVRAEIAARPKPAPTAVVRTTLPPPTPVVRGAAEPIVETTVNVEPVKTARNETSRGKTVPDLPSAAASTARIQRQPAALPTGADVQVAVPSVSPSVQNLRVSLDDAPQAVVQEPLKEPVVSRAEIDRLVKIGTGESLAQASRTFFFLAKDFQVALLVARDSNQGVEQAEAAMRDLAREFNGADGKKGFADIVMESRPNAETEANLRNTHLVLRDYYPPSSIL